MQFPQLFLQPYFTLNKYASIHLIAWYHKTSTQIPRETGRETNHNPFYPHIPTTQINHPSQPAKQSAINQSQQADKNSTGNHSTKQDKKECLINSLVNRFRQFFRRLQAHPVAPPQNHYAADFIYTEVEFLFGWGNWVFGFLFNLGVMIGDGFCCNKINLPLIG